MPAIKVCHLLERLGPIGAGAAVRTLVLGQQLGGTTAGDSLEATVVTLLDEPSALHPFLGSVACHSLGLSGFDPFATGRLRRLLQAAAADILHLHLGEVGAARLLSALPLGQGAPRVICQFHGDPGRLASAGDRRALRRAAPHLEAVLVPSADLVPAAEAAFDHPGLRVLEGHAGDSGVRGDGTVPRHDQGHALRAGAERVVGVLLPRLTKAAVMPLLEAMPLLLAFAPSTQLLVFGEGPGRKAITAACKAAGVLHNVDCLGELPAPAEVYAASDLLVVPAAYEGFAGILAEAWSAGVPVVASRVPGLAETISDGQNGMLVPPDDYGALATAIVKVFTDEALAENLRREGRRFAQLQASEPSQRETMSELCRQLLAR